MAYTIRPARRNNAKPLIGIHAQSGAGKTYSALVLARSTIGPDGKIVMIETEEGRGEAYADPLEYPEIGGYDVISMSGDYSPKNYGDAIEAANKAKPDALIIDSASHEWQGIGGVLDMARKNDEAGKKGMQVWQKPKIDHQTYFMNRFMTSPIPLVILCMRSKYPMVMSGSNPVRSTVLEPIQSEDILSEMFLHGWIDQQHKFHIGKITNKSLRDVFVEGEPISADTGKRLKAWMEARRDPPKTTAIEMRGTDGEILTTYERWGVWLDDFSTKISALDVDQAQAFWAANEDTFLRGQKSAEKNPAAAKQFADVGRLALEKRTPPLTEDEASQL